MVEAGKKKSRKVLLIDGPFQKVFLTYTILITFIVSLCYFLAVQFFFASFQDAGTKIGLSPNHVFFLFINDQKFYLNLALIISTIIITTIMFVYGLYMSNRIAGPIYHLKEYLKSYRIEKNQEEIKFRKNDFFGDLANEINATLSLNKQSAKTKE